METKKIITLEEDSSGIQFPTDLDPKEIVFVNIGLLTTWSSDTLRCEKRQAATGAGETLSRSS
jgi:hypothetical protein